jgi:regulation of enolase protein 1 (concanavalin A-like superfamily)
LSLAAVLLCTALCWGQGSKSESKTADLEGWGAITDPDGDCKVAAEKGMLTIVVPKTHHDLTYTVDYTRLNSPRVLQPAEGDFTLEVNVPAYPLPTDAGSSGGNHSFVSSGLLIWLDDKNFIRAERAAVAQGKAPFLWVERFKDGKSATQKFKPFEDKAVGLRIVRKGNKLTYLCDQDGEGKNWLEFHSDEAEFPAKLSVGVTAINSTDREFAVKLSGLKLTAGK